MAMAEFSLDDTDAMPSYVNFDNIDKIAKNFNEDVGEISRCYNCGEIMSEEDLCPVCGKVIMDDEIDDSKIPIIPQFRVVGKNGRLFQSGLFSNFDENKSKLYIDGVNATLNKKYMQYLELPDSKPIANYGLAFKTTAQWYFEYIRQKNIIKRGDVKLAILAMLLINACKYIGFAITPETAAKILGIKKSLSEAKAFLSVFAIPQAEDPLMSDINSLFNKLGFMAVDEFEEDKYIDMKLKVKKIIEHINAKNIAHNFILQTRIDSVTFIVLTKYGHKIPMEKFSVKAATIKKFLECINRYHYSCLESIYKECFHDVAAAGDPITL